MFHESGEFMLFDDFDDSEFCLLNNSLYLTLVGFAEVLNDLIKVRLYR